MSHSCSPAPTHSLTRIPHRKLADQTGRGLDRDAQEVRENQRHNWVNMGTVTEELASG